MIIKTIVRFPFLAIFYTTKFFFTVGFALSLALGMAFWRWVVVDEVTVREACLYWWNSVLFMWYPLCSNEANDAFDILKNFDRKWGTE